MKISEYSVKNYQFTLVIFIMVVILGITTLLTMPRAEDPEIQSPQFPVVVIYPGTSPQDLEELVVNPLEKKFSELEDVKKITTFIKDGTAIVKVDFKHGSNFDGKYQELVREINTIKSQLPADIHTLEAQKWVPSNVNIIQVALVSDNASQRQFKTYAKSLEKELERLPMFKLVEMHGLPDQIVRIDLNLEKLAHMHIPLTAVYGSIQSEMANIPGGSIEAGEKTFNIKTSGNFGSLDDIKNTSISSSNGKLITLKDVAEVNFDYAEEKYITRINGHRCVFVSAAQKPGYNISQSQKKYIPVLEAFSKKLPANIELIVNFDQADHVNKRLGDLGIDFLIAVLLVFITLLPLGGRAAVIVMISIPLSLGIGLVLLNLFGYTLNQLSIVGLVVALGLLVDDSIVVVENIERWLREGHARMDAVIRATKQIGLAVIGCTATLIIAFLPLVLLPGSPGDFIRSLPMAVILTVLASMVVSLTIIPFLSIRILKEHSHPGGNVFYRALQKGIRKSYAPLLEGALRRPWITLIVALIIFIGSLQLMAVIGFSLFPESEKPQFMVNVITPLQTNIGATDKMARLVEMELSKHEEIKYFSTNVGRGNPMIYYNIMQENERTDFAQIFVQLHDDTDAEKKTQIVEKLRAIFSGYAGAKIEVKNFEQGPPVVAPVEVRLAGENLDTLRMLANRVEEKLKKLEGTMYIKNPVSNLKTDIKVAINKEKASFLGIPSIEIDRTVRMAIAGFNAGNFSDSDGNDYDILLTSSKGERVSLDVFNWLYVNTIKGTAIPIKQVADLKLVVSPITINHLNKNRVVSVSSYVKKGYLTDNVINEVRTAMDEFNLPIGYSYEMGGEIDAREESFGGFGSVIIITVFLFIAVLILEFKTFKSTIIVLSVIPLGIVGAVTALYLTGNSLSFVAIIGLIALAGIEVKNSILLVDFTNQLRQEGYSLEEAIREAGEIRFMPIVLTSLTAIGGLLPIAVSSNPLISPLALVLIGGLISSTLLSRIVTPVVYKLIPPKIEIVVKDEFSKQDSPQLVNI